jgi:hypothetical protein
MAEQQAATPTDAAPEAPSPSWDDKLASKLGLTEPSQVAEPPQQAEEATAEGELAPDDIVEDKAPESEGEWFLELDRKGEKRKVSKEEAVRLAQQGWDYSTNQERLKAERDALAQEKAAIQAKAQITPRVIEAAGTVKYFENALQQYQNVDWPTLARTLQPQEYMAAQAEFQKLKDGYQHAIAQFNGTASELQKTDRAITEAELRQNFAKVLEDAPELRDPKRYQAEADRISGYLRGRGLSEQEIQGLSDARLFGVARDAMRYREALKARAERQQSSPALKPGAPPPRANPETRKQELVTKLHRAKDPAQKKALFDAALAAKLDRFG